MSERTAIEWCDATWSPWEGCTKAGPGCDHCYAESMNRWLHKGENWGVGAPRREYSDEHWQKPLRWNAKAAGSTIRVFPSVCDPFDNEVDRSRRIRFLRLIQQTPNLTWLLLTKRIGNAARMLQDCAECMPAMMDANDRYVALPNVWIGATVVNQEEADRDIPKLLAVPARVRFLSIEPMLGPIDMGKSLYWLRGRPCFVCKMEDGLGQTRGTQSHPINCGWRRDSGDDSPHLTGIDWVIAGGESGQRARPMHPAWVRSLRAQCGDAGVPFIFKQWGEWEPICAVDEEWDAEIGRIETLRDDRMAIIAPDGRIISERGRASPPGSWVMERVGKRRSGRLLDGVEHDGFPT